MRIDDIDDVAIVRQLLRAHEYWRMKQLAVDLVILNERASSYVQDLQTALETLVRTSQSAAAERRGRSRAARCSSCARTSFRRRRARCCSPWRAWCWSDAAAAWRSSSSRLQDADAASPATRAPPQRLPSASRSPAGPAPPELEFFNGLGGFAADGREYVTILGAGQSTPAPWINVIANPAFGFQVAVEGSGYTWSVNSRENQLTPWSNDPVSDRPGEVLYVRDEDIGRAVGTDGRCRSATRRRPTSPGTARATAASSTRRTASRSSSCSSCRSRIRSRSRG